MKPIFTVLVALPSNLLHIVCNIPAVDKDIRAKLCTSQSAYFPTINYNSFDKAERRKKGKKPTRLQRSMPQFHEQLNLVHLFWPPPSTAHCEYPPPIAYRVFSPSWQSCHHTQAPLLQSNEPSSRFSTAAGFGDIPLLLFAADPESNA